MKTKAAWASAAWSVLIFALYFRPYTNSTVAHLDWDVGCYPAHLYHWLGLTADWCPRNFYFPGTAVAWMPLGAIGRALAALTGTDVEAWLGIAIALTSFLELPLAAYLAYRFAEGAIAATPARLVFAWCLVLATGVLPYATAFPFFAHPTELVLAFAAIDSLHRRRWGWAVGLAVWLTLTRINAVFIFGVILGQAMDDLGGALRDPERAASARRRLAWLGIASGIVALPVVRLAIVGYGADPGDPRQGTRLLELLANLGIRQWVRFLIGDRNAVLFTAPWWIATFGVAIGNLRRLSWRGRAATAWMAIIILICVGWGSNGNDTGYFPFYRYMISSYVAAALIWLECTRWRESRTSRWLLAAQAISVLFLTWARDLSSVKALGVPLLQGPVVLTVFSWFPEFSHRVYNGTWFLSGPCLWTLTALWAALAVSALGSIIRRVRVARGADQKPAPCP